MTLRGLKLGRLPLCRPVLLFVLCAAFAQVCCGDDEPGREYLLRVVKPSGCALRITGAQEIKCKSRWHDVKLPCTLLGSTTLSEAELRRFTPDEKKRIGDQWQVNDAFVEVFGKRLFESLGVNCEDAQAFTHWTGTNSTLNPVTATGSLGATLREVRREEHGEVVIIALEGKTTIIESGRMASRFGPNWWSAHWRLNLTGELAIRTDNGDAAWFRLVAEGTVDGAYTNAEPTLEEPFTAPVDFLAATPAPLSPEQAGRVQELVKQLGDESFAVREEATAALRKLGPDTVPMLSKAADETQDPEVRFRLGTLINRFSP